MAFSFAPIRFVSLWGLLLATLGLMWAGYIVARALIVGDLNPGWPSLVAFLMIAAGVTNISLVGFRLGGGLGENFQSR